MIFLTGSMSSFKTSDFVNKLSEMTPSPRRGEVDFGRDGFNSRILSPRIVTALIISG